MNFTQKRKQKYNVYISILLFFSVLVLVNYFFYLKFFRIDLTQNKIYSLTTATKKMLKELDDVVSIKCFFSKDLPPAYKNIEEKVRDILSEYKAYAGDNLDIEFIDPKENDKYKQLALSLSVPEIQMNVVHKDKIESVKGYFGIGIYYGDKNTTIPVVNNIAGLEYEITSGIKRVISKKLPEIAITIFENKSDERIIKGFQSLVKSLEKQAKVRFLNLAKEEIDDNIELLIVLYPNNLNDVMKFKIDQYLAKGKNAIFLIQMIEPNDAMFGQMVEHNMQNILKNLGLKLEYKLIYDKSCDYATFRNGYVMFTTRYPFFIRIPPINFSKDILVFNRISAITLPWITTIKPVDNLNTSEVKLTPLFTTTGFYRQSYGFSLDPSQKFIFDDKEKEKLPLAYMVALKYRSAYKKDKLPNGIIDYLKGDNKSLKTEEISIINTATDEVRVAVIPNAMFISDDFLPGHEGNLVFIMNLIDWFTLGGDLMNIRSKDINERMLFTNKRFSKLLDENREAEIDRIKLIIKYLNMFLMPLLVVLFGLMRYIMRERKRVNYEREYFKEG